MPPAPGSYNWTQVAMDVEDGLADRMSRDALLYLGGIPEEAWDQLESGHEVDLREHLDAQTAKAVAEIEAEGIPIRLRSADAGRGASWLGLAFDVLEPIGTIGSASVAIVAAAQLVRRTYNKIARATGRRPMISLGAAEHLAIADLLVRLDRVDSAPKVFGSGDMCSHSPDRGFTGGDAFFVVLTTESELHHYQVSAYGDVFYIGTSPLIRGHWDAPPPYWADGDDKN